MDVWWKNFRLSCSSFRFSAELIHRYGLWNPVVIGSEGVQFQSLHLHSMDIHTTVVVVAIFFFVFFGFFGNLSFLYTIATNEKIRSSRGLQTQFNPLINCFSTALLLCILCVMHCVMLTHNFINVFRIMGGIRLTKQVIRLLLHW